MSFPFFVDVELILKTPNTSFFDYRSYTELSESLNFFLIVTLDLLVNGNADFTNEINLIMKQAMLRFIKETRTVGSQKRHIRFITNYSDFSGCKFRITFTF